MTPFPNLLHPEACASLPEAWEKLTYLLKPDQEGFRGLREDAERLFLARLWADCICPSYGTL